MNYLEPEEASEFLNKNMQNPDFVLLDIRRKSDFLKNWIDGAINMPYYDEDFDKKLKKWIEVRFTWSIVHQMQYQILPLRPWMNSISKVLIKSPVVFLVGIKKDWR